MDPIAVATEALHLQIQLTKITADLEISKEKLREIADNKTLHLIVENLGKIDVTIPRIGGQKTTISINEKKTIPPELRKKLIETGVAKEILVIDNEKLQTMQADLVQKLIQKNILQEQITKVSAAKAAVRIQPNS